MVVMIVPIKKAGKTSAWIVCTEFKMRYQGETQNKLYSSEYYGIPQEKRTFRTLKAAKAYAGVGRD